MSVEAVRGTVAVLVVGCLGMTARAATPALVAEYEVVFEATWTAQTHPMSFPGGAHFSPLIGGTHTAEIAFWTVGGLASPGIEGMAESGSPSTLRNEVLAEVATGDAGGLIQRNGNIGSTATVATTFSIEQAFPLATVVTMIAPSPDWFVGTSGTPLFVDGAWRPEVVQVLQPYDAGTDSGLTYSAPNADTNPQEPITEITGPPFTAPGTSAPPLGTFTFRRLNAPPCPGDIDRTGRVSFSDLTQLLNDWGPCPGCAADLDGDETIGFGDLTNLLNDWGACG